MALKTVVTMTVSDAALEKAHRAMQPLVNGQFGPVETSTSRADGPTARTKLQLSLAGDVRDQVEEQLAAVPVLAYDVEVREGS
ncbi:hypothetical protein ABZ958_31850 [Streptomyces sp. NPDC046237]|uniref:hypothetical protein n=1 Tax=Streptomyces sp. NPDC046237 TaxID=3154914 RepID=UPI003407C908